MEKKQAEFLAPEDLAEINRIGQQRSRIAEQLAALQGVNAALEGQHKALFRAVRSEYGLTEDDRINGQTGEIERQSGAPSVALVDGESVIGEEIADPTQEATAKAS